MIICLSLHLPLPNKIQTTIYQNKNYFQFFLIFIFSGKLSDDLNTNNNKWTGSCNSLLQSKQNSLGSSLQSHHTSHHAAVAAAALTSPFSSLLSGGGAGYLLDPLGGLNKSTAANHLF